MNVMQVIAPAITHPTAVWVVAAFLLAWALWSGQRLARGTGRVARALEAARARIEAAPDSTAFAAGFAAISDALTKDPLIGARWQDYRASLVLPATPGRPVRATARGIAWFDVGGLLRSVGVDSRYHAALPNLLVGAGLLFTFLGLAAALGSAGDIVSAGADSGVRNEALRALLDTASFKFITSLVGLLLSILYALFRKRRLQGVESALDRFLAALEARVPLMTPAALQQEANVLLERQNAHIAAFSTEIAASIGSALDKALDRRLGEHVAPLAAAMQRQSGGSDDRMLRVAESLAALGTRLEGVQTGLGASAVRMAQSADAMATRMGDGAEASLRSVAATLTAAAQRLETQMGKDAAASSARLAGQFEAMLAELRALAESSRATGAATFGALAEKIGASAAVFEATATKVAGTLAAAADTTGGALGRGAEDAVRRIAEATEGMRAAMQAMLGEFHGALGAAGDAVRGGARESGDALRRSVDDAGSTLAAAVAGAAAQLDGASRNLATLSGGLAGQVAAVEGAAERIAARFAALEQAARDAATPLAEGAADLKAASLAAGAAIEPLRAVADGLRTGFEQMGTAAQTLEAAHTGAAKLAESLTLASARFENLDREMADTVQALQDGLRGFTRQVRDFVVETDENLARSATQLGHLAKDLEATIGDFLDQVKRRSA